MISRFGAATAVIIAILTGGAIASAVTGHEARAIAFAAVPLITLILVASGRGAPQEDT